jgi:hypothetical protein
MKINTLACYLKIVEAMDDFITPSTERIVYGEAAQYRHLKNLAAVYTKGKNCLALVGFVGSPKPEKAYFDGKELLIVTDGHGQPQYYCVKDSKLHTLEHTTISFYLQETAVCEQSCVTDFR